MRNDDEWDLAEWTRASSAEPEPWRVDLGGFEGVFAEEPLSDRSVINGIAWRGIVIRQDEFPIEDTTIEVASVAGAASVRVKAGREELEEAAPEVLREALNDLTLRARALAKVMPATRNTTDQRSLRIGIDGVTPEWQLRPRRGGRCVVSCQLVGRVRLLSRPAFEEAVKDGFDLRQRSQPVLRKIDPVRDRSAVEHLADGQEVVDTGKAAYDRNRVVDLLLTPSPSRLNFLVVLGGEDVGFAHLDIEDGDDGQIAWPCMCIASPTMQGRGLGTRILLALIAQADAAELRPMIELKGNEDAVRRMAEQLGFELAGMRGQVAFYDRPS